jgi:hypothetical protein
MVFLRFVCSRAVECHCSLELKILVAKLFGFSLFSFRTCISQKFTFLDHISILTYLGLVVIWPVGLQPR